MWNRVDKRLGAEGEPPPEMVFAGRTPYTTPGPIGQRQIVLNKRTRKSLRNPKFRRMGQRTVAHEFRHARQPDELWVQDRHLPHDDQPIEQDAFQFAREVMRSIPKRRAKRK